MKNKNKKENINDDCVDDTDICPKCKSKMELVKLDSEDYKDTFLNDIKEDIYAYVCNNCNAIYCTEETMELIYAHIKKQIKNERK
ncbi:MAG: hypothetical protein ACP5RI_04160 [Candidatus Micrarchaeia archaeon]